VNLVAAASGETRYRPCDSPHFVLNVSEQYAGWPKYDDDDDDETSS